MASLRDLVNKGKVAEDVAPKQAEAPAQPPVPAVQAPAKTGSLASLLGKPAVVAEDTIESGEEPEALDISGLDFSDIADDSPDAETLPVISAEEYNHPSQPDGLTRDEVVAFKNHFQILRSAMEHPEQVSDNIKMILLRLKEKPEFRQVLLPEDLGAMTRALRVSYGVAITKKSDKREKTSNKKAAVDEIAGMLGDINFTIG